LLFHLPRVQPRSIRSARLIVHRHVYRLRLRRVRNAARHGAITVRRPPTVPPTAGKSSVLVLTVSSGSPAAPASRPVSAPPPVSGSVSGGSVAVASGVLGAVGCLPGWGSFAVGSTPPGCWRPYSPQSPFNREVAAGAPVVSNSQAIVDRLVGFGGIQNLLAGTAGRGELDGGRPIYWSSPSDPVFTLHCTESWGTCAVEGAQVRIPDRAQPAGGSDAHLSVIDQASGVEYDLWGVQSKPPGGGTLTFRWGGKTRIDGTGLGSDAVAAQYGTAAGVLRAEELASGHINHALFLGVHCDSGTWVYPATKGGSPCSDPTNAPPEGTRFVLTLTDPQIQALPVPDWKKTILTAMAHYGMIVGDTGGSWGIAQESGVVYTSFGQTDKWVTLAQQLHVPYYAPDQDYVFNLNTGIDWQHNLKVIAPCASQGTC
ncbi:MAG TPA: hypothetical protein VGY97_12550, partial [Solirubrobacteraceae bacterium]|nr:hypothetical protein [Solirubrobacteraceae bacterium]